MTPLAELPASTAREHLHHGIAAQMARLGLPKADVFSLTMVRCLDWDGGHKRRAFDVVLLLTFEDQPPLVANAAVLYEEGAISVRIVPMQGVDVFGFFERATERLWRRLGGF